MNPKNIISPSLISIPSAGGLQVTSVIDYFHNIEVVASLPGTPAPNTTYYVGAQSVIGFSGLDGDTDELYVITGWIIGASSNDASALQINGITTNNYDFRYGYAGSTINQTSNNSTTMNLGSMQGNTAMNQLGITIEAKSGKNRPVHWWMNTIGVAQQVVSLPLSGGGLWRNSVDNLTSIQFTAPSVTGMYGVGTFFRIGKLIKS